MTFRDFLLWLTCCGHVYYRLYGISLVFVSILTILSPSHLLSSLSFVLSSEPLTLASLNLWFHSTTDLLTSSSQEPSSSWHYSPSGICCIVSSTMVIGCTVTMGYTVMTLASYVSMITPPKPSWSSPSFHVFLTITLARLRNTKGWGTLSCESGLQTRPRWCGAIRFGRSWLRNMRWRTIPISWAWSSSTSLLQVSSYPLHQSISGHSLWHHTSQNYHFTAWWGCNMHKTQSRLGNVSRSFTVNSKDSLATPSTAAMAQWTSSYRPTTSPLQLAYRCACLLLCMPLVITSSIAAQTHRA